MGTFGNTFGSSLAQLGAKLNLSGWLLITGLWADSGKWDDTQNWID